MSVRGGFGYRNIIPNGGSCCLVINCKAPITSTVYRQLLINGSTSSSGTDYCSFESNGKGITFKGSLHTMLTGVEVKFDNHQTSQLNYLVLDYDGSNTIRLWNETDLSFQTASFNLNAIGDVGDNYTWMYSGPPVNGAKPASPQSPDIFYCIVYRNLMDYRSLDLLRQGVQPLNIFSNVNHIYFYREYPLGNSDDYINSIGTFDFVGTRSTNSNQFGANNYSTPIVTYNQDRGQKIKYSDTLTIRSKTFGVFNNTIPINSVFKIPSLAHIPLDLTYTFNNDLVVEELYDLVDKYLHIYTTPVFANDYIVSFERTVNCDNTVTFDQLLKVWDGIISTEMSFGITTGCSLSLIDIYNTMVLGKTDIGSNIRLSKWTDTCYFEEDLETVDLPIHSSDISIQRLIVREEIVRVLEVNKVIGNNLTFRTECRLYKSTFAENFGS